MKKAILIFCLSRSPWIGGIYYRRNIINMMCQSSIIDKYNIIVLTNKQYAAVFSVFGNNIILKTCSDKTNTIKAMLLAFFLCMRYRVKYIFPIKPYFFMRLLGIIPVSWIADFQHCYYPEFFENAEVRSRNKNCEMIGKSNNPLVLSSYEAWNDLKKFYNNKRSNVHVIHFTSFIDDELERLNHFDSNIVLEKYGLVDTDYCIVCNQFWKHKNHAIVLDAIEEISRISVDNSLLFVFTGELNDRRDPNYYNLIKEKISNPLIGDKVKVLGFINRIEQLLLMREAKFVIQPSLFEGWGTVVEDAKKLNKRVLLSDIPVHREQMDSNCLLFKKKDPTSLARLIISTQDCFYTNETIKDKTIEYAKSLEDVFI